MLQIWLESCRSFGVDEILINIHAHAAQVKDFLRSSRHGLSVHSAEEKTLLDSGGTLLANREWVPGESSFWIFYADVLHNVDLTMIGRLHASCHPTATIGVYRVPDPTRCGVVEVSGEGVVTQFVEKPTAPRSNLAFAGIMIATPELLDSIPLKPLVDIGFGYCHASRAA